MLLTYSSIRQEGIIITVIVIESLVWLASHVKAAASMLRLNSSCEHAFTVYLSSLIRFNFIFLRYS